MDAYVDIVKFLSEQRVNDLRNQAARDRLARSLAPRKSSWRARIGAVLRRRSQPDPPVTVLPGGSPGVVDDMAA